MKKRIKNQAINCIQTISNSTDTEFENEELCVLIIANTIEKMIEQSKIEDKNNVITEFEEFLEL